MNEEERQQVIAKMYLMLDGCLPYEEEQHLAARIKECPHCYEMFEIEKAFKTFVYSKMERQKICPICAADIKKEIKSILVN